MDIPVIIVDSDDEDLQVQPTAKTPEELKAGDKRPTESNIEDTNGPKTKIRRIQPTKIGEVQLKTSRSESDDDTKNDDSPKESENSDEKAEDETVLDESKEPESMEFLNELTPEMEILIKVSRKAERSKEMNTVINKKLLKYYHSVHPSYITSKTFLKMLQTTTDEIIRQPHSVYSKLRTIIEELDVRRKSKMCEPVEPVKPTEETPPTETNEIPTEVIEPIVDDKNDIHLKKLHKALVALKRLILDLDEQEVDWEDDDNSAYLKKVRYEKRACEIYKKICELTGESEHAHRTLKKPIAFKGTDFPEFNKLLQRMVNHTNLFPNYRDVLKKLDYCNKKYDWGLTKDRQSRVAQEAFEKLGKVLQDRRRTDLYETATFYVGKNKDPAKENPELRVSLEKNKNFYARYDDIINEYAKKEEKTLSDDAEEVSSTQAEPVNGIQANKDEEPTEDLLVPLPEKNGDATNINLDDDVVIISEVES